MKLVKIYKTFTYNSIRERWANEERMKEQGWKVAVHSQLKQQFYKELDIERDVSDGVPEISE